MLKDLATAKGISLTAYLNIILTRHVKELVGKGQAE